MKNVLLIMFLVSLFSVVSCTDPSVAEAPSEESAVEAVVSTDQDTDSENEETELPLELER